MERLLGVQCSSAMIINSFTKIIILKVDLQAGECTDIVKYAGHSNYRRVSSETTLSSSIKESQNNAGTFLCVGQDIVTVVLVVV